MIPGFSIKLPSFRRGDSLKASDLNAIVEALRRVSGLGVGRGLLVTRRAGGIVLELVEGGGDGGASGGARAGVVERLDGKIVGCTVAEGTAAAESDISYTVRFPGRPDLAELQGIKPTYGRPVRGGYPYIYPSPIGSACLVIRRNDPDAAPGTAAARVTELMVFDERVKWCAPDGSSAL